MGDRSRWVTIEVDRVEAETDAALLCSIDGEEVWLPRSHVEDGHRWEEGDSGEMVVTRWIANQEGLEYGE